MTQSTNPRAHGVLKIGILCHPTYGGSGVVASELALTLAERGHKVHLFSHAVPPRLAHVTGQVEMHIAQGFPYPLFHSTPHDLAITSTILNIQRESGLDILHAHYALPHAVSAYLARSAAIADRARRAPKIVTTLHGTDITLVGNDPSYAPLTQFVIEQSDAVTAVSENLARRTRENFCREPLKTCAIEVIPNGVDTDLFHPAAGEGRDPIAPTAVHVSNFREVKRVPWLLEAFARASVGTNAKLQLVGDGPEQPAARAKARELGIEARVEFLGERDRLPEILAPADVFLLTSSDESFGLSALEAMSCGTAVVATAVGGVGEVVDDGINGLLSGVDDKDAFAANVVSLLFDRRRAKQMGAAARHSAETKFARGTIVQRYEDVYMRLLLDSAWPFP
ncbi:MAG: N-acetyl-alpha-D-glucosaminyl L-malate synthase BshA [Planctomycetota bacterium]|nr:N-acetyl-alpha-D-glucosaminyl L-malate synthase BshA [Planctomycetota bacterium]